MGLVVIPGGDDNQIQYRDGLEFAGIAGSAWDGTTLTLPNLAIGATTRFTSLHVAETVTTSPRGIMSSQHVTSAVGSRIYMRKSRGTLADPSIIVMGDDIGRLIGSAYDSANYLETAAIVFGVEGTIAATRMPSNIKFYTSTDATPSVQTLRLTIDSSGSAIFTGAVKPIGHYANKGIMFDSLATRQFRITCGASAFLITDNYQPFAPQAQDDVTTPSWYWAMGGGAGADYFRVSRTSAGSTTLVNLLDVDATGDVTLGAAAAVYLGSQTENGSWRIVRSGNNLVFERREGGAWITKSTIAAA